MCHPSYKTFQFWGNNWREVVHLPFPFVFSSWAFGVKFFWIIVRTVIEVINGAVLPSIDTVDQIDLARSTSGLSGRCPEVAVGISPWI